MSFRYCVDPQNSAWREVDGEIVLINSETTYYYSLNEIGSLIWRLLLEHDLTAAEISVPLAERCNASVQEIEPQVAALLEALRNEHLVTSTADGQAPDHVSLDGLHGGSLQFEVPQLVKYDTLEGLVVSGE